jgi:mRNA-degrading endonuclease RelE of RelBE toxin-antitoxin system
VCYIELVRYTVKVTKKAEKGIDSAPDHIQDAFQDLSDDLAATGPVQSSWPNFSKLGKDKYHCHLAHKWVACWTIEKGSIIIEVYYAGSRENAPY